MTTGFRSATPRALISREVFARCAREAVAAGGVLADLRHDAFGHGVVRAAPLVIDAGAGAVRVDDDATRARLEEQGVPARTEGEPDIDTELLYGIHARSDGPAMSLRGRVLSTKPLLAGEAVSYGYSHRAAHDTVVALVTGGYAQGIVRALGNRAEAEVSGRMRPIVGRIAMDVCVIDVGEDCEAGTPVIFFGGEGPARRQLDRWTGATGLTAGELLAVAGSRAEREWAA